MGEWLIGHVNDLGPSSIVVIIVLMILTDRLVTRARLREVQKQSENWRLAHEALSKQLDAVVFGERLGVATFRALADPDSPPRRGGEPGDVDPR